MARFLLGRLAQSFVALFLFALVVFALSRAAGDPINLMVSQDAPAETVERVRESLGLDKPVLYQLAIFYRDALTGDFGLSIRSRLPVTELLASRLVASLQLAGLAMGLAVLFAIPLGVAAAAKRGTVIDRWVRIVAGMGQAMPSFWFGILLIALFAVGLRLLPSGGSGTFQHMILPAATMAIWLFASLTRLVRSTMLDVLGQQYVLTARGKGLPERTVLWRHALRNALLPVVTFAGGYLVVFISSAVIVETVFAWPGIGRLALEAIQSRDFPVMQGMMLMTAALATVVNLLIDVSYAFLDPRVRLS